MRTDKVKWTELITGILLIFLGIYSLIRPVGILTGVTVIYGLFAVITGIADIAFYVRMERRTGFGPAVSLVTGILSVLAGILILVNPFEAAKIPFIVLGASSIVYGLTDLFRIIRYRRKSNQVITDVEVIEE